jgi:hypothetical protein
VLSRSTISGVLAALAAVVGLAIASPAGWAQAPAPGTTATPPAPGPSPAPAPAKPAYEVSGFRGARFDMDETQVRAAIQTDFAVKPEAIKVVPNAMERTTALVVSLPTLDPGPGAATVVYILGYKTKKLIQVNVVWTQNVAPDKADSGPYLVAGVQLANYFNGFGWRDGKVTMGAPSGPNTLLLFAAEDGKTGAVQVVVDGVAFERKDGKVETAPQAPGSVSLRVAYIANRTTPDIYKLEPGRF